MTDQCHYCGGFRFLREVGARRARPSQGSRARHARACQIQNCMMAHRRSCGRFTSPRHNVAASGGSMPGPACSVGRNTVPIARLVYRATPGGYCRTSGTQGPPESQRTGDTMEETAVWMALVVGYGQ